MTATSQNQGANGGNAPLIVLPPLSRHLSILGLLTFTSLWGTLARLGLVAINTYPGQSIAPVIWAQGVGCFIMGWAMANKKTIDDLYPPLYTAITTGFCGCITTFSVWVLECFRAYGDQYHHNRSGFYNVRAEKRISKGGGSSRLTIASVHTV